jgi:hypothetical protein
MGRRVKESSGGIEDTMDGLYTVEEARAAGLLMSISAFFSFLYCILDSLYKMSTQ